MKRWDIKDLTLGGLFTALIAVGAFLKITIPVQPVPMHFTLQFSLSCWRLCSWDQSGRLRV